MNFSYKDFVVNKPWGYEYLVYESKDCALWLLYIKAQHTTSMHCHPRKTTGLVVIDGTVELSFVGDKRVLSGVDKAMIRRGLFHSTKSISETGSFLFEIENPNDKEDLVRLSDVYGRGNKGYETAKSFSPRTKSHFSIKSPEKIHENYQVNNTQFSVIKGVDAEFFKDLNDKDIVMFLKGGLGKNIDSRKHLATMPGDVLKGNILKTLSYEMEFVESETLILLFKNNES